MPEFSTIDELVALAKEAIPHPMIDYILAGEGSGGTLRRNRQAFDRIAIEQELLPGSQELDLSTQFLDISLESPLMTAPMGVVRDVQEDGDFAVVRGANSEGSLASVANGASHSLKEIASEATGPLIAQITCSNAPEMQQRKIDDVNADERYKAVAITVDGSAEGRLDSYVESRPQEYASHPKLHQPANPFTWAGVEKLCDELRVPVGLKGVMSAKSARQAVDHGARFIWVSNHGARKFDSTRATIDVLDEIATEVGPDVPLIVDSGFQRGSDVLKGLAKGATLVAFGKLTISALGVGGAEGVANMLRIVKFELRNALACTGNTSVKALTPEVLHEISY